MSWLITQTKIMPPRYRPDLVTRPRLTHLLDSIVRSKLFLVIAPAGYGKTSLLTDWVHSAKLTTCWYAVAASDRDPHQFMAHFIAALRRHFPSFGLESEAALAGLARADGSLYQLIATMANELYAHADRDYAIIIDDYHLVDSEDEINDFLGQFLQEVDDRCHLVLSSRTLLSLPDLDLLVARGQVDGVSSEELAFTAGEIQQLAEHNFNRRLDRVQAERLATLSEGWITGLLLSAQTEQWRNANHLRIMRASGVDLYSYLAQQVLDRQPDDVRQFLLHTSLMEDFDTRACQDVLSQRFPATNGGWQHLVDYVRQNNLFVSEIGEQERRLRYHPLFQQFLQNRLLHQAPQDAAAIAARLARVYIENSEWDRVLHLYGLLGDTQAQIEVLTTYGVHLLHAGRIQLLVHWIEALPPAIVDDHPELIGIHGYGLVVKGDMEQGVALLNRAEADLRGRGNQAKLARTLASRAVAHRLLGDYGASLADAEECMSIAATLDIDEAQLRDVSAMGMRAKGLALSMSGSLDEGLSWLDQALTSYRALADAQNVATVTMEIGLNHLYAGNYRQSLPLFTRVLTDWRQLHNVAGQAYVLNNIGFQHFLQGDYVAATNALVEALQCAGRSGCERTRAFALATLGDVLANLEMWDQTHDIYTQALKVAQSTDERFLVLYLELARAILAWSTGRSDEAYALLSHAGEHVLGRNSIYEWGLYRLAMGRFYVAGRRFDFAIEPLADAARQFESGGQLVEMATSYLYLAAAQAPAQPEAAIGSLTAALVAAFRLDTRHAIIAVARAVQPDLAQLRVDAAYRMQMDQLLEEIREFNLALPSTRRQIRRLVTAALSVGPDAPVPLAIRALGRADVYVKGRVIAGNEWQTQAARELFFCLLAHPDGLTKEQIGALFWPDCTTEQLKTRFKNTIYRMRSAIGSEDFVIFEDGVYRFNQAVDYEYDVEDFTIKRAEASHTTDPHARIAVFQGAVDLYRGPFLPSLAGSWVMVERERLHRHFADLCLELAALYLVSDQANLGLIACQRILSEDPCLEEAHRLAMRIHAAMGNRAGIASQYAQCRQALLEEVDAPPSPQTEELYARLIE